MGLLERPNTSMKKPKLLGCLFFTVYHATYTPGKNSAVGEHGRNKITTIYQQISTSQGKNTAVGEHGHNSLVQ